MSQPRASAAVVVLLGVLTCAAYTPVFDAGFIDYDDPWLIEHNPHFGPAAWDTPWRAFTALSHDARMSFGAEYLPLRDLLGWLESRLFGLSAPAWHTVSVLLYLGAVLFLRGALLRTFSKSMGVELAVLLFALHPAHAESVAWLAGQKDVLALLFVCWALYAHAGDSPWRRLTVPLLALAACLSKSMSVAVVVLLVAQDLVRRRAFDWLIYALTGVTLSLALGMHVYVGRVVGMVTEPAGGSRYTALITMGAVWLKYLALAFMPWRASIAHDVPDRLTWDVWALAGYALLALWLGLAVHRARSGHMRAAYTLLWFMGPLLPVSQVLMPLQNRMADRYAWLSVLVPCVLLGFLCDAVRQRLPEQSKQLLTGSLCAVLVAGCFVLTFQRAALFTDAVLLFLDGTLKTEQNAVAPYQLGRALEAQGKDDDAIVAFRETLSRTREGRPVLARRASNALASLHAKHGRLGEAERVLRMALVRFPDDYAVRNNLARLLRARGRRDEAEAVAPKTPAPPRDDER